jgi:hypothetical protein
MMPNGIHVDWFFHNERLTVVFTDNANIVMIFYTEIGKPGLSSNAKIQEYPQY